MDPLHFLLPMTAGVILAGSLAPAAWLPAWIPNDKLLHVLAYGAMAALLCARFPAGGMLASLLAACFAGGVVVECLQRFIPGRGFCLRDIVANGIGIAIGASAALVWVGHGG